MSTKKENLSLQAGSALPHVVVLGEVLWDLFEHSQRLGGAPLNFGVTAGQARLRTSQELRASKFDLLSQ